MRGERSLQAEHMSAARPSEFSATESEALSHRLREELARRRMTRQGLADAAKISISTLEKVLSGRRAFTLATIVRIEEGLGAKILERPALNGGNGAHQPGTASDELGNYSRAAVAWLEGSYVTLRPSFGERGAIYAYRTEISWSDGASALVFREGDRIDSDYAQFGTVSVPHQSGHIYLVTNRHGQHRMIVLARPTNRGEMHGLLTTLQAGKGAHLSPVATPIVLRQLKGGEKAAFGRIARSHASHAAYAALLKKTLDENFAAFLLP
jgi:transcriptional regulator with XRE-family HTH domain